MKWTAMRKVVLVVALVGLTGAGYAWYRSAPEGDPAPGSASGRPAGGAQGAGGPGGAAGMGRPPMTVELATARRDRVVDRFMVVGNLTGAATVSVSPKVPGRLDSVMVRIGDRVTRSSVIAQVDDREIREQVKQAEASFQVAQATIRQREADLLFAKTNLDRSRNLFERQLLPRQTLDDAEARAQAATAQLDLAHAQFDQAQSRLEELRITLENTTILTGRWLRRQAFVPVQVEVMDGDLVEVPTGIAEGARVVTTGAAGLRDGDRITEAGVRARGGEGRREAGGSARESGSEGGQGRTAPTVEGRPAPGGAS